MPVLGALRNLSFGRSNDENKLQIVREQGLQELMLALKMSRITEVKKISLSRYMYMYMYFILTTVIKNKYTVNVGC